MEELKNKYAIYVHLVVYFLQNKPESLPKLDSCKNFNLSLLLCKEWFLKTKIENLLEIFIDNFVNNFEIKNRSKAERFKTKIDLAVVDLYYVRLKLQNLLRS
jgi:hypothetical protein